MLNSHEIASLPIYVLTEYKNYISEKELVLLLHFLAVQESGKKAWEIVAERMGYENIGPITTMLNRMEKEGYIVVHRGNIDASPLYNNCLESWEFPLTGTIEKPTKPKKDNTHYIIAAEIKQYINVNNLNGLANRVKSLLKTIPAEDIVGAIKYIDSYWEAESKGKPQRYKIAFSTINEETIQKWIDGGRKEKFTGETKKKKVFTKI